MRNNIEGCGHGTSELVSPAPAVDDLPSQEPARRGRHRAWRIEIIAMTLICVAACGKDAPASEGVFSARTSQSGTAVDAPDAGAAPMAADLRQSLKTLAVASECMRRSETPPEEVATTMLALYKEHGVDLAVYAREMGRLGGDAAFQAEIQSELERCPTPAVAMGTPPDVTETPPSEPDVAIAIADDVGPSDPDEDDVAVAVGEAPDVTGTPPEPEDVAVVESDDVVDEGGPDTIVAVAEVPDDDLSGTWTGAVRGSVSATLRVIVRGRRISSASMTWGGQTVRLQGTIANNGHMSLGGRINASDFVRLRGRINKAGRALSGTWDGVVGRKRAQGSIQLSR